MLLDGEDLLYFSIQRIKDEQVDFAAGRDREKEGGREVWEFRWTAFFMAYTDVLKMYTFDIRKHYCKSYFTIISANSKERKKRGKIII